MFKDTTTILAGGRTLPIAFSDGRTEEIKVRQLPIRLLASLNARQGDEPALVELYCDKEDGWADSLTHESYHAVVTVGDEINRPPYSEEAAAPGNATRRNGSRPPGRAGRAPVPARKTDKIAPHQRGTTLDDALGYLCARHLLPPDARSLECSPHLVLWLYEHHNRQRFADALLNLRVAYAAAAPGALEGGKEIYQAMERNLEQLSDPPSEALAQPEEESVWPPPRPRRPNP